MISVDRNNTIYFKCQRVITFQKYLLSTNHSKRFFNFTLFIIPIFNSKYDKQFLTYNCEEKGSKKLLLTNIT